MKLGFARAVWLIIGYESQRRSTTFVCVFGNASNKSFRIKRTAWTKWTKPPTIKPKSKTKLAAGR
eukprot:5547252-Amphidinium_carterae.2